MTVRDMALLAMVLCASACGSGQATQARAATPVERLFPIDGVVDLPAVGTVHERTIELRDGAGSGAVVGTTTVRWAARNDDRHLYLALEWDDATASTCDPADLQTAPFDAVFVRFDADGDGTLANGEDVRRIVMTRYGSLHGDLHQTASGPADDAVGDGMGKMTWASGRYRAELLVPVAPDAAGEDGALGPTSRFDVVIYDGWTLSPFAGRAGALSGAPYGVATASWERVPWTAPERTDHPTVPGGLGGLLVLISDHENPQGEIYTFDPSTGALARVTHGTGLYLDGASLSHDRRHVAFFASPARDDFAHYEVYTVDVDGTNLTTVTSNAVLDGHPAWSPDDGELVYASFRGGGSASLIRCTPAGVELANLTPAGANDNDPDWTPDGRIVFKTDRFGTPGSPEVRIAVMNADGSGVRPLTSRTGSSDHDVSATGAVAVFERFTRPTDYATDPSAQYAPWDLVEARLDGSGERTLLADGWVNWLPVTDPSGRWIVHLKTVGSGTTEARLMTAAGEDLGRLVPDQTRIRYVDWK